ncbi:VP1 [Banna-like virus strain Balaton/2010/HUN]|nr:VP1 [Banna-like virus strain Balaton/2010/HUN]
MDIQLKFEDLMRDEVKLLNEFEQKHFDKQTVFHGESEIDLVVGKNDDYKNHYHSTLMHESDDGYTRLGTLINWSKISKLDPVRSGDNITDARLRRLVDFDRGWIPFAVILQQYLDEGGTVGSPDLIPYQEEFINNVKHPRAANDFLGISVIKECETFLLLDDDQGIKNPDILRCWEIDSIPEQMPMIVDGVEVQFPMRKNMLRRINDEAPMFFFCNPFRYATLHLNPRDPAVQLWLDYFLGCEDFFGYTGSSIVTSRSLLAHKRFEAVVTHIRKRKMFAYDAEDEAAMLQWLRYIIVDPIFHSYKNRSHFGNLNQHIFARTKTEGLSWSISDVRSTNFRLKYVQRSQSGPRFNMVDDELVMSSVESLITEGLTLLADITLRMISADITRANVIKGKLNRIALAYCGYTGSHSATAMAMQFNGTKDMNPRCDPTFTSCVTENMKSYMIEGTARYPQAALKVNRLDVLFKGGTSSASSTEDHAMVQGKYRVNSILYSDKDVDNKTVFKTTQPGVYRLTRVIKSKLKSKNAYIMTHPQNFINFNPSDISRVVNAGSRLVKGTRAKRIITPNYGSIYAASLVTVLPTVRLMSSRESNMHALTTQGRIGTTYHGALPHDVMAPELAATTTGDTSFFAVAKDFGQFDTSQWGEISRAHAEGVRSQKKHYTGSHVGLVPLKLDEASMADLLEVTASSYDTPLLYKMVGLVCESAGVKSGELTTQSRNTTTNDAHSTTALAIYNLRAEKEGYPKVELVTANKVGDDSVEVYHIIDGTPLTRDVAGLFIECLKSEADNNHLELSPKRTVVGNNVVEHIKIWVYRGYLAMDVFLDSLTSEKNSFANLGYLEQVNILYDMAMTMMIRYGSVDSCMQQFTDDMMLLTGIRAGNYTFIPNPKLICAYGTPEIALRAPEIRSFGRYLPLPHHEHHALNRLVATMSNSRAKQAFLDQMVEQNPVLLPPMWLAHFERPNGLNPNGRGIRISNGLKKLMPEYCSQYLNETIIGTLDERSVKEATADSILTDIITGRLAKAPKPAFHCNFYLSTTTRVGCPSPYLTADKGVQNVHEIIGLSYRNATASSPTANVDRILRNNPGSAPAYLTGNSIFGVLSDYPMQNWASCLEALDITEPSLSGIIELAQTQMHAYLADKDLNTANLFDNTSRTYNVSSETFPHFVELTPNLSRNNINGFSIEAMKHVIYMARLGIPARATPHPLQVGTTTYHS